MAKTTNMAGPLACHLLGQKVSTVGAVAASAAAKPLPRKLVIPPGTYRVHGRTYEMRKEGSYRFLYPLHENQQRIVFEKDILALASGLCWMHSHGTRDEGKPFDETVKTGMREKLILTCGPYTNFVSELYRRLGIRHRVVSMKTLEEPNRWNDGHVTMEVFIKGQWVIVDHDPHTMYRYRRRYLSLLDMIPHVKADDYDIVPLAASCDLAVSDFKGPRDGYDYGLLMETLSHGRSRHESLREGLRRVMMIPCIAEGGVLYTTTTTESDRRRFRRRQKDQYWGNLTYLREDEFRARFYGRT